MKSNKELERELYISNHPLKDAYAKIVDLEDKNEELELKNDELSEKVFDWDDWK